MSGPILSLGQTTILMGGAQHEGWASLGGHSAIEDSVIHSPEFRSEYEDILTSILLFGPAQSIAPHYLKQEIINEKIVTEGLLTFSSHNSVSPLKKRVGQIYKNAFDGYRSLELLPATAPIISIDTSLNEMASSRTEAEVTISEIMFMEAELRTTVDGLVSAAQSIFAYYFDDNLRFTSAAIAEYNEQFMNSDYKCLFGLQAKEATSSELFSAMGLCMRSPEILHSEIPNTIHSYRPGDLLEFDSIDQMLTSRGDGSFENHLKKSVEFSLRRDAKKFVSIHAFWRSLFELTNMLSYSQKSDSPLFLPSAVDVSSRNIDTSIELTDDAIQIYRLYLTERGTLPRIKTLDDLIRLMNDKRLNNFRNVMNRWTAIASSENGKAISQIRADINSAKKEIESLGKYHNVGRIIGYVSIPIAVIDLLLGSPIGLLLTPIGPGIDLYSHMKLKKFGWLNFGT